VSTTLSNGTITVTPTGVEQYATERESRNIVHVILGTSAPAVDLSPAALRTGSLKCWMATRDLATSVETLASSSLVITLADSTVPAQNMHFIATDSIAVEPDEVSSAWIVSFGFQEVS
jgi:hypothetical protein